MTRQKIVGKAEDLANLAHRRARAISDDGGGEPRVVAAKALVNILDHHFAPLMLEIDVYVGRLVARGRNETFEQQIVLGRIDLGDAEAKTHRAIGRRAAPLREYPLRAGEAHDVVNGQE